MSLSRPRSAARRAATSAAAAVLLTSALAACGGGSSESAPENASEDEFCAAYLDIFQVEDGAGIRAWAEDFEEVGTPDGIGEEERRGFEVLLEYAAEVPEDTALEDIEDPDVSAEDEAAGEAFALYVQETCADQIQEQLTEQLPDLEAPSDAPSEESAE